MAGVTWQTVLSIISALVAIGMAASQLIPAFSNRRKNNVAVLDTIIDNLREETEKLREKADELEVDLAAIREGYAELKCSYDELKHNYDELERRYREVLAWASERGYVSPQRGPNW